MPRFTYHGFQKSDCPALSGFGQRSYGRTLPANVRSQFPIPAASAENVTESGSPAADAAAVSFLEFQQGVASYQLELGNYRFIVR